MFEVNSTWMDILRFMICLFAVYGLVTFIISFYEGWFRGKGGRYPRIKLVLLVRDVENDLEFAVRSALKSNFIRRFISGGGMTIVDVGSTDGTQGITKQLAKCNDRIECVDFNSREEIFKGI
jgi:hypothetical protein